jgi:hypothetical protein
MKSPGFAALGINAISFSLRMDMATDLKTALDKRVGFAAVWLSEDQVHLSIVDDSLFDHSGTRESSQLLHPRSDGIARHLTVHRVAIVPSYRCLDRLGPISNHGYHWSESWRAGMQCLVC